LLVCRQRPRLRIQRFHCGGKAISAGAAFFSAPEIKRSVCGICGVAFASRSTDAESRVREMTAAMRHRGGFEESILAGDARAPAGLAVGVRRLSIIDSGRGTNLSGTKTRVAGYLQRRVYNYRDLSERLALCGHRFAAIGYRRVWLMRGRSGARTRCTVNEFGACCFRALDLREALCHGTNNLLARDATGHQAAPITRRTREGFAFRFGSSRHGSLRGAVLQALSQDRPQRLSAFWQVRSPMRFCDECFRFLRTSHALHVPERRRTPRARTCGSAVRPAARDPPKTAPLSAAKKKLRPLLE